MLNGSTDSWIRGVMLVITVRVWYHVMESLHIRDRGEKIMKKTRTMMCAVLSVCVAVAFIVIPVKAPAYADMPMNYVKYAKNVTVTCNKKAKYGYEYNEYYWDINGDEIKVTYDNNKIIKKGEFPSWFTVRKPGTTKATIKVKKNGKWKTYKSKVKVVNYKNPAKKFKIAGKSLKTQMLKEHYIEFNSNKKYAKVIVTPSSGWKVKKIDYYLYGDKDGGYIHKKIKSGAKVRINGAKKDYSAEFDVRMYNSKMKKTETFYVSVK